MLGYSAGVARGAKLPWSRAGSGSMLPTINKYVVVTIPARLDAKFWIPPMEATWPGVGATSPGRDQIAAAVNARLAQGSHRQWRRREPHRHSEQTPRR